MLFKDITKRENVNKTEVVQEQTFKGLHDQLAYVQMIDYEHKQTNHSQASKI